MPDLVTLQGALSAGPQEVCDGSYPATGTLSIAFGIGQGAFGTTCAGGASKPAAKRTWNALDVNSPGAYVVLEGIGAGGVAQANLLWLRSASALLVRLTFANPAGGADIVSVIPVQGLAIVEPSATGYLKTLEVQGTGRLEYFASGNA